MPPPVEPWDTPDDQWCHEFDEEDDEEQPWHQAAIYETDAEVLTEDERLDDWHIPWKDRWDMIDRYWTWFWKNFGEMP
jgi:hypothetical protein